MTGGRKLVRRLSLASVVAVGVVTLAGASSAAGAVTIGQTGNPTNQCAANVNRVQAGTAGPPGYAVPAGLGVITSWSIRGSGTGKMMVWRPTAAADQFIVVGKTNLETFDPAKVRTFTTRIPVQPNDLLGMRTPTTGFCYGATGAAGDTIRYNSTMSEPGDGSTQTLDLTLTSLRILVAASVEPDCDRDGLGDETQDKDLSALSCQPQLKCKGKSLTMVGTNGADTIVGTDNRDVISALDGKDKVSGLDGRDLICGDKGKDTLKGGKANDTLLGKKGKDKLKGGKGRDTCKGGKGNDSASACEVVKSI